MTRSINFIDTFNDDIFQDEGDTRAKAEIKRDWGETQSTDSSVLSLEKAIHPLLGPGRSLISVFNDKLLSGASIY